MRVPVHHARRCVTQLNMNHSNRTSVSKIIRILFAVGGTIGILLLAWKYVSWEIFRESLQKIQLAPLAVGLLLYTCVTFLRGLRYKIGGADIRCMDAFSIAAVHAALLRVMPFRSGELAYGILLKRTGRGGFGEGMAAILVFRLLDFLVMLIMTAFIVSTYFSMMDHSHFAFFVGAGAVAMTAAFFCANPIVHRLESFLLTRTRIGKKSRWIHITETVAAALKMSFRRRLLLLLSTVAIWVVMIGWMHFLMRGIGITIGVFDTVSSAIFGLVGSILPLSIVGNFGPLEGGLALGLCQAGFTPQTAATQSIIISTLTLIMSWILAVPGGIWVLAMGRKPE